MKIKIDLNKILHLIGTVAVTAPVIVAAVKPVIDEVKGKKTPGNMNP